MAGLASGPCRGSGTGLRCLATRGSLEPSGVHLGHVLRSVRPCYDVVFPPQAIAPPQPLRRFGYAGFLKSRHD